MRERGLRLGRLFGIEVSADLGVLLIGGLLTWSLATVVLPSAEPGRAPLAYWSVAAVGAVLFLGSLLAHEMSHSVVARRNGVEVEGVTLWLFGGVARFRNEAKGPGAEFRIAAAGPAMSLALGLAFIGAAIGLGALGVPQLYVVMFSWLGLINGFLAVFNLLPGAPLDGGRILAAALWRLRGDRLGAKVSAAKVGRGVAMLLIAVGVAEIFFLRTFGGIWTVFIGWFLLGAARMEEAHYAGERALGDLRVGAAMLRDPQTVRVWTTVADTVEGPLRSTAQDAVPVLDFSGRVAGLVTMDQIRMVPAEQWPVVEVGRIMVPADAVPTATPDEKMTDVMDRMTMAARGEVFVMDGGRLVGLLGPSEFQRAITIGRLSRRRRPGPPPPPPRVPVQRWEPPVPSR
jgi:Zn-dependent protease/CBS domain-containing protein